MVPFREKIDLKLIQWSPEVEAYLSRVETDVSLDWAKQCAETGDKLIGVMVDGELRGVFMIRLETSDNGKEMSVLWGAGHASGIDLTREVLPEIERIAKEFACKAVFFLTRRKGLISKAESIGYQYYETVMKKAI